MAFPIAAVIGAVAAQGLSSYLQGQASQGMSEEDRKYRDSTNAKARGYLQGYGYQTYESPYSSFFDEFINRTKTGNLTAGQEQALNQANQVGLSNINTAIANRGGTVGGQLAMVQKHNQDLSNQRVALADQNVNSALSAASARDQVSLSDWLNQQSSKMKYQELLAQYA